MTCEKKCEKKSEKKCEKKSYGCHAKYVQAGRCESGDGSKCHPWNSLALAQASTNWKTLVVLSSPIALDGGILLKDGQKLVGEKSPVDGPLSYDQPTITNTNLLSNGGNGVLVQSGSVYVKNIHITNTQVSAINYDNATNLVVKNVLATGHNQSQSRVAMGYSDFTGRSFIYYAGIHGQNGNNGKTTICNSVIRNNFAGPGVYDVARNGASREFKFVKSEVSALKRSSVEDEAPFNVTTFGYGVVCAAVGVGSNKVGKVYKSSAKDFLCDFGLLPDPSQTDPDATRRARNIGFSGEVYQGASTTFTVEKSSIINMNVVNTCRGQGIYGFGLGATDLDLNTLNFNIICCVVTGIVENTIEGVDDYYGFFKLYDNTNLISVLKDNTVYGFGGYVSADFQVGNNDVNELIEGNNFLTFGETTTLIHLADNNRNFNTIIRKNNFLSELFYCLSLLTVSVWNSYNAIIEDNCIQTNDPNNASLGSSFALALLFLPPAANVIVRRNNLVADTFTLDLEGGDVTTVVDLAGNYWQPSPPTPDVNVYIDSDGTITLEPFAETPFVCPKKKYCLPEILVQEHQVLSSLNTLSVSNRAQQFKEKLLNRERF